jgi:hypothetical protein
VRHAHHPALNRRIGTTFGEAIEIVNANRYGNGTAT